jgi:hypothetical protein
MAKKYRTDDIASLNEDWGGSESNSTPAAADETNLMPYSGAAVQKFVREKLSAHAEGIEQMAQGVRESLIEKVGYLAPMNDKDASGYYHLRGFASQADYLEWASDKEGNADLLLCDVTVPISDEQGAVTLVELSTASNRTRIVSVDGTVKLRMRFTSQEYNPMTGKSTDTYEDGTLTLQRRSSSAAAWTTVGTYTLASVPADSDTYTDVDVSAAVGSGTCQLRVIVTGQTSGVTSSYVTFQEVVKTSLTLEFRTEWARPITNADALPLEYSFTGAIAKTLVLCITSDEGLRTVRFALGTDETTETTRQFLVTDSDSDAVKILTHGVKSIEAWLSVDVTSTETVESEHVFSQVMYVADADDTTPHLIVTNALTQVENWTTSRLMQYAVYAPGRESLPVLFRLTDKAGTTEYWRYEDAAVEPGREYDLTNAVEIDSTATSITAYMHYTSGDTVLHPTATLVVDNSADFAPTSGAAFVLNPKTRSNSESAAASIVNTATGKTVDSTWKGFGWVSDGWVADDDGVRVLRVPSGRSVNIAYEAFKDFATSNTTKKTGSLTVEIDFAVRQLTDDDGVLMKMCTYQGNGNPLGWEMRGLEGVLMTVGKQVRLDQNAGWQEGKRTHLVFQLLYNLSGAGENYCKIYINSVPYREFNYASDDMFCQYVNGVLSSGGITIGGTTGDIDIYSMRIYHLGLSSAQVRQDYLATLPTGAEKKAYQQKNDILSNGLINYAKAKELYNVLVWTGTYPTYGNTKNDKFNGDLEVSILGDPAHSGVLSDMNVKGQGTSSMSYWWWNGQWAFNSGGTWVDGYGVDRGAGYQLWDGLPLAVKLVGKVNFASSMQSHKMGSCNLYNDCWRKICPNSIVQTQGFEGVRAAVPQKPFLLFVRESADAEPVFKSFVTFGPGKGDKPTFGYDKAKFPAYLCIEGADNDMPVVMGRVPWDDDCTLDGEDWKYNGKKQFSLVFGDTSKVSYFKTAWNFVYQYYPNILPYTGTLAELRADSTADTSVHYWMTAAGAGYAKYDLYRWDDLTSTWVEAGLTKQSAGKYSTLNINTQCGSIASGTDYEAQNKAFIAKRAELFKAGAGSYFKPDEAMFHMNFTKVAAATDNRCKNIYAYLDPTTLLIGWYQDDLDTIVTVDNVGKMKKPYYVEEHDTDEDGAYYWNGEGNALFNLFELAYPTELREGMKTLLQTMATLSDDGTVMGAVEKYYFEPAPEYFPAVAYAEVARLVYETARIAYASGKYTNGTDPITQSLGSQLETEREWWKKRIAYISSYCGYGEFGRRDGEGSAGSLNFRSIVKRDGTRPSYKFTLKPHIWLYPTFAVGSSLTYGTAGATRVKAGESYTVTAGQADGNTNIYIGGIDHYRSVGNFASQALGETFSLAGERLTEFEVSGTTAPEFRPVAMNVASPGLRSLVMHDVATLVGTLDLSAMLRLKTIDLTGCSGLSGVTLPETEELTTLALPANLTSLTLKGMPNLTTLDVEGTTRLASLAVGAGVPDAQRIFADAYSSGAPLQSLHISGVDWTDMTLAQMNYLASMADCSLTGTLTMKDVTSTTHRPTFVQVMAWCVKWGNINDSGNALHVKYYQTALTGIGIKGEEFVYSTGAHTYEVYAANTYGNDVVKVAWSLSKNSYCTLGTASGAGVTVNVGKLGDTTTKPTATLTCTVTKVDGSTLSASYTIGVYPRQAERGDYVYYDGTFGPTYNGKTVVGVCFYVNPENASDRRMVACKDVDTSSQWGLYPSAPLASVALADSPSYDCYNIASLPDITAAGTSDGTSYIKVTNYIVDEETLELYTAASGTAVGDGLGKPGTANTGLGTLTEELAQLAPSRLKAGDSVPGGMINTLKIIQHRNKILQDSGIGLDVPKATATADELSVLNELISKVVADNGNSAYQQYYYPAASRCYAYQPTVKSGEVLAEQFKAHNWYLPSEGELCRIYFLMSYGATEDYKRLATFEEAYSKGVFTKSTAVWWSSTEYGRGIAWSLRFADGFMNGNYFKSYSFVARAVAAF